VEVSTHEARYSTIKEDLEILAGEGELDAAVILFHTPPHETTLDRAALDGRSVDHVPLALHVGSIAVRRFIELRQPLITLHGHIHESPRLTGSWKDRLGRTHLFSAAHDGPELALVRVDLESPEQATRILV
jgi:Icc-related predicted phosphoesterase